jgi:amino acid transporter
MLAAVDPTPANLPVALAPERRLRLPALTCIAFFTACGGAFGIEPLVGSVGPGIAVFLICATPLLWSLPIALMAAELTTLMPEEGGYYVWVREALGPFWGVQEAWWSLCYTLTLMAIFPVLFVNYLGFLVPWVAGAGDPAYPALMPWVRWGLAMLVVLSAMATNLRGARDVGASALGSAALVLGAFALLVVVAFAGGGATAHPLQVVLSDLADSHPSALLIGLSTIVFNFSGWDNVSPYAAEVEQPRRNYPIAIGSALGLAVLAYLLPVLAGIAVTRDPALWTADAGWPVIAGLFGGPVLGAVMAVAGLVSMWGLYNAQVLFISRIPYALARDGWFPAWLAKTAPGSGVPTRSVILICLVTAPLAALSFPSLVIIQCVMYASALMLEFLALIVFRVRRPDAPRPFRIPGGRLGLAWVCLAPLAIVAGVLYSAVRDADSYAPQLLAIGGVAVSGIALYLLRRNVAQGSRPSA